MMVIPTTETLCRCFIDDDLIFEFSVLETYHCCKYCKSQRLRNRWPIGAKTVPEWMLHTVCYWRAEAAELKGFATYTSRILQPPIESMTTRALYLPLLSSFSHICHSSSSNTQDDLLSSFCCGGLTFHTHTLQSLWKSVVRGSVLSPGNTYNYSPLLGSLCIHRPWQVSLPVDMCRVGGQHFNVVSTAILDSSYFAP